MTPARTLLRAALFLLVAAGCTQPKRSDESPRISLARERSGPKRTAPPEGATVLSTAEALGAAIAHPEGPRDIWLGPGTLRGDWTIKRPLALHGTGDTVLEGTGTGNVLTIQASDVTIDNVIVRRSGMRHTAGDAAIKASGERIRITRAHVDTSLFGVALEACKDCLVEDTRVVGVADDLELKGDAIKLWEAAGSVVRRCFVEYSRDVVVWYSRGVTLEQNVVTRSRYGSHFMYAHDSVVRDSIIEDNVVGIFVMYSARLRAERNILGGARGAAGVGIGFKESDGVGVDKNWIVGNTTGIYLDQTPRSAGSKVTFSGNTFGVNDVALRFHGAEHGLRFEDNTFRENVTVAEVEGGGDAMNTEFLHNAWSDYVGYDMNRDGFGDVAFEVKRLSGELTDAHPTLRLFHGTAAMSLIDAVARAVPVLAARRLLVDKEPRILPWSPP